MTDKEKLSELLNPWLAHLSLCAAGDLIAKGVTIPVRCKDCEYGELVDDGFSLYLCHHHGSDWNEGEHFCSYGERKDNG